MDVQFQIGGQENLDLEVRVIAATHRNIADAVHRGEFRENEKSGPENGSACARESIRNRSEEL